MNHYAEALRRKANWIDLHGDTLLEAAGPNLTDTFRDVGLYLYSPSTNLQEMQARLGRVGQIMRDHRGSAKFGKVETKYQRGFSLDWGDYVTLRVVTSKSEVCTRRQVGTRTVPATEAQEVPLYESDCAPMLSFIQ